jgi:hypothetical protein
MISRQSLRCDGLSPAELSTNSIASKTLVRRRTAAPSPLAVSRRYGLGPIHSAVGRHTAVPSHTLGKSLAAQPAPAPSETHYGKTCLGVPPCCYDYVAAPRATPARTFRQLPRLGTA